MAPVTAFNAYGISDEDVSKNETIVFETVLMNEGDSYDPATGKFVTPLNGLYTFTVFLCTNPDKYLNFAITADNKDLLVGTHYDQSMSCGSGSVFAQLRSGQEVWVRSISSYSSDQLKENVYRRNAFMGALLQGT